MARVTYVCTTCSQHFTTKYSAKRHNIIAAHRGEIVTLVEYLMGRLSGRYQASHPSWYRKRRRNERATVAVC
jgi:TPP-dependent pyruvate/acetoin dehydrogenase alpha subunit